MDLIIYFCIVNFLSFFFMKTKLFSIIILSTVCSFGLSAQVVVEDYLLSVQAAKPDTLNMNVVKDSLALVNCMEKLYSMHESLSGYTDELYPLSETEKDSYHWALSTNLCKWAFLGTMNISASFPIADSWTVDAGARYNPWTYYKDSVSKRITWRERTLRLGARWWTDGCFSNGFYAGLGPQWMQYNRGGVISRTIYEGSAIGAYLNAGYHFRISEHWSLEAGLGAFLGYADYATYDCTVCGKKAGEGRGLRGGPDEANISFYYIF